MKAKKYPRICDNCKYFDKWPEDDPDIEWSICEGTCRRYPQTVGKSKNDWCGEFAIMRDPRVCEEDAE